MAEQVLRSWKEIARYLGCGVRTVQRWERDLGLPVRRPRRELRSPVVALTADLDAWLARTPVRQPDGHEVGPLLQSTLPVVAVVDDDESHRYVLARMLARAGFSVVEAGSGEGGIRLLKAVRPDVAVIDWRMPGMDGLEVCRRIRRDAVQKGTAVIIYTSAETGTWDLACAQLAGASAFHEYRGDTDELIATVRKFISEQAQARQHGQGA